MVPAGTNAAGRAAGVCPAVAARRGSRFLRGAISCTYTTTPDEDFILDRIGPVVIGAGFSGHGFKFTPVVGRILADLASGTRPAPSDLPCVPLAAGVVPAAFPLAGAAFSAAGDRLRICLASVFGLHGGHGQHCGNGEQPGHQGRQEHGPGSADHYGGIGVAAAAGAVDGVGHGAEEGDAEGAADAGQTCWCRSPRHVRSRTAGLRGDQDRGGHGPVRPDDEAADRDRSTLGQEAVKRPGSRPTTAMAMPIRAVDRNPIRR